MLSSLVLTHTLIGRVFQDITGQCNVRFTVEQLSPNVCLHFCAHLITVQNIIYGSLI